METIKINDIIRWGIGLRDHYYTDLHDISLITDAIDRIVRSDQVVEEREETVRNYIGLDPYSWTLIPNFSELEELGVENVLVEYADGMVVEAPLCY